MRQPTALPSHRTQPIELGIVPLGDCILLIGGENRVFARIIWPR